MDRYIANRIQETSFKTLKITHKLNIKFYSATVINIYIETYIKTTEHVHEPYLFGQ